MAASRARRAASASVMWGRRQPWADRSRTSAMATSSCSTPTREYSRSSCQRRSSTPAPKPGSPERRNSRRDVFGNTPSRSDRRAKARSPTPAARPRKRVMQTSNVITGLGLIGLALGFSPAAGLDGTPTPKGTVLTVPLSTAVGPDLGHAAPLAAVPVTPMAVRPSPTPFEALRSGTQALRDGRPDEAVTSLEYAAGKGVPGAMWKLGRMYADGDGVDKNKLRAFEYFQNLTKGHAYDPPGTPQSRFVANAFVSLGQIYLEGIPETSVQPDPYRARQMFSYAASYFGDPDAQYYLARLFLDGAGGAKDARQAVKWLGLAANKGQYQAQAALGAVLFEGKEVARQSAMGLFWLTIAKDSAGPSERWIADTYSRAFAKASDDERALAYRYLENWLRSRRQ